MQFTRFLIHNLHIFQRLQVFFGLFDIFSLGPFWLTKFLRGEEKIWIILVSVWKDQSFRNLFAKEENFRWCMQLGHNYKSNWASVNIFNRAIKNKNNFKVKYYFHFSLLAHHYSTILKFNTRAWSSFWKWPDCSRQSS